MQTKINKVELRNLEIEDYKQLKKSMIESYPEMANSYWRSNDIKKLLSIFPEGQLVILVDDIVVGSALSLIVDEKLRSEIALQNNYLTVRSATESNTISGHTDDWAK